MTVFPGRALGLLGFAMIAAVGVGATAVYLLVRPPTPESLEDAAAVRSAPVVAQEFSDPRTVEVILQPGVPAEIRIARAGVVTSSTCAVGASASSGTSTFAVDGVALLDLHTAVPLWRELRPGDRGPDVDALKAELARLGLRVSSDTRLGAVDLSSIAALLGRPEGAVEALAPGDVVWLPAPKITFASCDVATNSRIEDGATVGTVDGGVSVALGPAPSGLLPGARTLTVEAVTLTLDASLAFTDLEAARGLTTTTAYRESSGESESGAPVVVPASIRLTEPLTAWALPPTALTITQGAEACVTAGDGAAHRVTILTSQLGSTVVAFDGVAPESVRLGATSECS